MTEATLRSVAERAGVHYATASRALDPNRQWQVRPATRARIQRAADELNYRPHLLARGLRRGETTTVGLVVADLGNPFITPVIRGLTRALEPHGLQPIIAETEDDADTFRRAVWELLGRRVDALVIAAARLGDRSFIKELVATKVPLVLASRRLPGLDVPSVVHDGVLGGQLAAEHLAQLGHRVVAQISGPADIQSFVDRGVAFRAAANALEMRVVGVEPRATRSYLEEGRRQMSDLLNRSPLPTAAFAHNDLMAIGALDAIRAGGLRCPEDISVVGHDDAPLVDHICPPLTTIRTRGEELGRLAGEMVVKALRTPEEPPQSVALQPTLVIRESTAPRDG
jgi:LacI family transcriptional regulator